jgi:AcrR family transcriptional regulator
VAGRIYENAKERILDAAERLLLQRGPNQLSVEALISEAGLSKGGFFHHFATKDALLLALLERLIERGMRQIEEIAAKDPEPRGARLRAQIALAFDMKGKDVDTSRALVLAFIEASGSSPALAQRSRAMNDTTFARDIDEGIPAGRAMLIQFALDGFWLGEALGSVSLTAAQKKVLRDSLLALAQPEPSLKRTSKRTAMTKKGRSP